MRRLVIGLIAVLGGCGQAPSEPVAADTSGDTFVPSAPLVLSPLELAAKAQLEEHLKEGKVLAALEQRVRMVMDTHLFDPGSAQYLDLRAGRDGAACGRVNAKNRLGAYVGYKPFVADRDGRTLFVSTYADGIASELHGSFARAYLNHCASKQEIARHTALTTPVTDYDYQDTDYGGPEPAEPAMDWTEDAAAEDASADVVLDDPFEQD